MLLKDWPRQPTTARAVAAARTVRGPELAASLALGRYMLTHATGRTDPHSPLHRLQPPAKRAHAHPTGPWYHSGGTGRHSHSLSTAVGQAWRTPLHTGSGHYSLLLQAGLSPGLAHISSMRSAHAHTHRPTSGRYTFCTRTTRTRCHSGGACGVMQGSFTTR